MPIIFMPRELPRLLLTVLAAALFTGQDHAQGAGAEEANTSDNPLSAAPGLNFQDYYAPGIYSSDRVTNDFLARGTPPLPPVGFVSVDEVMSKMQEHPSAN
jgi:hypothetical protein